MFSAIFIARPKFAFVISIVITLAGLIARAGVSRVDGALVIAEYQDDVELIRRRIEIGRRARRNGEKRQTNEENQRAVGRES